jgi:predicted nucleotidyltransferase component of viral defense system
MANPSMRGNIMRADKQRRAAGIVLHAKDNYDVIHFKHTTKQTMQREVVSLCEGVKVQRIACEGKMPREAYGVTGRRKATINKQCYGNGRRLGPCIVWA